MRPGGEPGWSAEPPPPLTATDVQEPAECEREAREKLAAMLEHTAALQVGRGAQGNGARKEQLQ